MNKKVISTLTDCKSYLEYQIDHSDVDENVCATIDEIEKCILYSAAVVSDTLFEEVEKELKYGVTSKYFEAKILKLIELIDTVQTAMLEA